VRRTGFTIPLLRCKGAIKGDVETACIARKKILICLVEGRLSPIFKANCGAKHASDKEIKLETSMQVCDVFMNIVAG
jgi:hypothetical protein